MCGIVAIAGADTSRIDAGIRALAHRGPDGNGKWLGDRIALGHTRLAVVDPVGGAQPIENEDGTVIAVVNGEIYDAHLHAKHLTARGHTLRSHCDAELLVHLYEEVGDNLVHVLRGELAFVLWDARKQRLFAARDRFGVKPLLWAPLAGGGIALASEAKALFAMGVVPARWDAESFFHAATTQYTLPDRTLFDGVYQLEPGRLLEWNGVAPRITPYYVPPFGRIADLDEATAADALRATLRDAVRVRLRADTNVCVQLSGGLDSTSVAALAANRPCFTVAFRDGGAYDERAIADATARALDIPLHVVEVTADDIATYWPEAVAHGEGLAINGHLVGKFLLSRAMRDAGFKVALTGEGADELLCGYAHLRRDAGVASDHAASRGLMLPTTTSSDLTQTVQQRLGFVPTWIAAKAELGARVRSLLARDFVRDHADRDPFGALVDRTEAFRYAKTPMHASAAAWLRTALASYILRTLGDGMEMRHGIEGRVPFLDHRLAELAISIPPAILAGDAIDKPVLRRAMADLVPAHVLARPKHPFLAPPLSTLAPTLVQDTLRATRNAYVDHDALIAVLDRLPTMSTDEQQLWDPALMLLLSASLIEARYCR